MHGRKRTRIMAVGTLATVAGLAASLSDPAAAATPAPQPAASLAFTHSRHDLILIGAGVIVLLFVILVLRVTRRRRETASVSHEPRHTFPSSADTWHNADLARESNAPLPSFRRSEVVLPAEAPGWHPVQGDPMRLAYWDGTQWVAYRQWDGQQWVDAAAAPR
jgi:hypothetical protein